MLRRMLAAFFLFVPSAALAFDPESYTSDETLFADLTVQDLQSQTPAWGGSYSEAAPLVIDELAYWGSVWPSNGWCIPGMDTAPSGCGGDNIYLASAVDLHVVPVVPIDRIGFRFGSQGSEFFIQVMLSDGSSRTFKLESTGTNQWGSRNPVTGFFGYGTGDASHTIEHLYMWAADGGIDDIRYGLSDAGGTCDELGAMILGMGLHRGIEQSLLAKVDAAERKVAAGKNATAINIFQALLAEIDAQAGKKIAADHADALASCVEARIDALR